MTVQSIVESFVGRRWLSALGKLLSFPIAIFLGAGVAAAVPPPPGVDPGTLDVAGVKIGMTADEAANALKGFDAGYSVAQRFFERDARFGYYGLPIEEITTKEAAVLVGLHATKDDGADHEEVYIYLSPIAGKERVILVSRAKQFGQPQLVTNIAEGIFSKYPKDTTFDRPPSSHEKSRMIGWRFDGRGRVMSAKVAQQEGLDRGISYRDYVKPAAPRQFTINDLGRAAVLGGGGGGSAPGYGLFPQLPQTVMSNGGIALDVTIGTPSDNLALANGFGVILYQGSSVFEFNDQASAACKQKKDKIEQAKQQAEIEKAKSNAAPATKF